MKRGEPPWKRIAFVAVALATLVFFLVQGGEQPAEKPVQDSARLRDPLLDVPMPATPHKDVLDEARGMYILENDQVRFSLELAEGGRFHFVSRMTGQPTREASGSWNLVGNRLTMSYALVNGKPFEGDPIVNVYRGRSIELLDTGLDFRVILEKRTMLRKR